MEGGGEGERRATLAWLGEREGEKVYGRDTASWSRENNARLGDKSGSDSLDVQLWQRQCLVLQGQRAHGWMNG